VRLRARNELIDVNQSRRASLAIISRLYLTIIEVVRHEKLKLVIEIHKTDDDGETYFRSDCYHARKFEDPMRSTATLALTLMIFSGILSAGEPVPLPIEDHSINVTETSETLYEQITCCPEAVANCNANGCEYSSCDYCDACRKCDECEDCETCRCRRCMGCYKCPGPYCNQMMQHLPYYPASTGDYYFRPYNYKQIATERILGPRLGESIETPYAATSFDMMYRHFEADYDASAPNELEFRSKALGRSLPDLETLLSK